MECEDPTAYRNSSSFKNRRLRTVVNVNRSLSPPDVPDRHARVGEQPTLSTSHATKTLSSPGHADILNPMRTQHFNTSTINSAILDSSKLLEVLPSAFVAMDRVLQAFALHLMEQGRLMPFQMTIGLCKALEVAHTDASRKRAMQLLYTLSKFPNTQLTEMGNVGKWLLDVDNGCSSSTATTTTTTTESEMTRTIIPENDTVTEKQQKQQLQDVGGIVDGEWVLIGENTTTTNVPQQQQQQQDDQRDAVCSSRQHKAKYFDLRRLLKLKRRSNAGNDGTSTRKGGSTCSVM